MLHHTHSTTDDANREVPLSQCRCGRCDNIFWVRTALEHQPGYCPYCGQKFTRYDVDGEGDYGLNGLPRPR